MNQRTILITGASDGIGAAAAHQLAERGHRLLLVGRSPDKLAKVAREVGAPYFVADYSRLDDVRRLAREIRDSTDHLDVLANNAGGVLGRRAVTVDGHEQTFQVNHLAPFLLTNLLLDVLRAGEGVVVNTSSSSAWLLGSIDIDDLEHEKTYTPLKAYADAKLQNVLFTLGLQARHGATGISPVVFDPGNVATNFASETTSRISRILYRTPLARLVLLSPEQGGSHLAFFADGTPGQSWMPGLFYTRTKPVSARQTNPQTQNAILIESLWNRSASLVGLEEPSGPGSELT